MAINRFDRPARMADYQPVPFREIAFAGDKLRQTSEDAFAQSQANMELDADVFDVDAQYRDEFIRNMRSESEKAVDLYKSNPQQALEIARRAGLAGKRELSSSGKLGQAIANKKAGLANFAEIKKKYEDAGISSDEADRLTKLAYTGYKGVGERNDFGAFNSFQSITPAFLKESMAEQGSKFSKGWKADKFPMGLKRTKFGFVDNKTKKRVTFEEVAAATEGHLRAQPNNVAYAEQQGNLAIMGMNPEDPRVQQYRQKVIDDAFKDAAIPSGLRESFSEVDSKLHKDWQLAAQDGAVGTKFISDYLSLGSSTSNIPLPLGP